MNKLFYVTLLTNEIYEINNFQFLGIKNFKGALMQIWKSPYILEFILKL